MDNRSNEPVTLASRALVTEPRVAKLVINTGKAELPPSTSRLGIFLVVEIQAWGM